MVGRVIVGLGSKVSLDPAENTVNFGSTERTASWGFGVAVCLVWILADLPLH